MTNPEPADIAPADEANAAAAFYLKFFGVNIGDMVKVFPIGVTDAAFSGHLVDIAINAYGPVAISMRRDDESPFNIIPWSNVGMLMLDNSPVVDHPAMGADLAKLVEFADSQGLPVLDEVRALVNSDNGQEA